MFTSGFKTSSSFDTKLVREPKVSQKPVKTGKPQKGTRTSGKMPNQAPEPQPSTPARNIGAGEQPRFPGEIEP